MNLLKSILLLSVMMSSQLFAVDNLRIQDSASIKQLKTGTVVVLQQTIYTDDRFFPNESILAFTDEGYISVFGTGGKRMSIPAGTIFTCVGTSFYLDADGGTTDGLDITTMHLSSSSPALKNFKISYVFTHHQAQTLGDIRERISNNVEFYHGNERNSSAQAIPAGSSFVFNKDIVIEADKENVLIGAKNGNISQCLLVLSETSPKQRKVSAGRTYKVKQVTVNADAVLTEALITLEGSTTTISCFANYPNKIIIGDISDSVAAFGIDLNVLKLEELEEAP